MRKPILYALFALAATSATFLYFFTNNIKKDNAYYEAIGRYVYAYTGGAVSSDSPLRVRFVNAAVSPDQVGKPVASGLFQISPAVRGTAIWEDDRTILLKPEEALHFGQKYAASIALRRIYEDAPVLAKRFEFDFYVRALAYDVVTDGVEQDPEDPSAQRVVGRVKVNEPCSAEKVEQMLAAKQGNKALKVNWVHSTDGKEHEWSVVGVERTPVASFVKLNWTGEAIGVPRKIQTEQVVPAADDFGVITAKAVQLEEQYVLLNFSEPVSPTQDLNGLVRLEGYEGKVRCVVMGNFVRVYPAERISGQYTLSVGTGVRSTGGKSMNEAYEIQLDFRELNPAVRLVGRGCVVPQKDNGSVLFPFEAVGLSSVDVEVFKIFNNNIPQFLQLNELEGEQELERVGKIIHQTKVDLKAINPNANAKTWQRYALDLKDMIAKDPHAIYQVRVAFRREYTDCDAAPILQKAEDLVDDDEMPRSIMGGYRGIYWDDEDPWYGGDGEYYGEEGEEGGGDEGGDGDNGGYNWSRREQPCAKEYYFSDRFAKRNVFVSDLGLTAKLGRDRSLFAAVTNLHTAQPVGGVQIDLYSYQLQPITSLQTASDGAVFVENLKETPFLLVANDGNRRGYLRLADGGSLSLSRFDVAGVEPQKGMKGYIYGERGVWRPGDSLFLNFVLEDKGNKLPVGHPVNMELRDPRGAVQYRTVRTSSVDGVYAFHCATRAEAPTGNWTCTVNVGGATFTKTLKIETVKPNRLKIDLNWGRDMLTSSDFTIGSGQHTGLTGNLKVTWLHGATARGLKSTVEMQVVPKRTEFKNFKDFTFDDPNRSFYSEPQSLFEANIDQNGQAQIPLRISRVSEAAGKLSANFKVRAFEAGGDFSTDNFSMEVSPYERYVGIRMPQGTWGNKTIDGRGGTVSMVLVDRNGKPLANQTLQASLFRVDWRWWWEEDRYSRAATYNRSGSTEALKEETITTNSAGVATWRVRPNGWGRYMVRIQDTNGSHSTADYFWSGYPEDEDNMQNRNAASMLPFTADKDKYVVGEEVTLKVPAAEQGRILLTLENGSRVARHLWFDAKSGDNLLKFRLDEGMAPTVYAHIALMQPHAQTLNDLPIRMYGVLPLQVEDPSTRLEAQIDMPDILKPDESFNVSLKELGGKACTYTLAIVDEGLLDLTRFKTPNPHEAFYAREALGVKTWDIFDFVLGAYAVELERILSIGGDGINTKAKQAQVNRFKPTVIHLGPYKLEKGETAKHRLKISNYVGSVRVMAVLSNTPKNGANGAYGNAEKTCPVRKPLMILPTFPRVLGPGETLKVPVSVFAMEKSVQNANVSLRDKSGLVSVEGSSTNTLRFAEPGDQMTYFNIKVGQKQGIARFVVSAEGGAETATSEVEIAVRNPNPVITTVADGTIEPGKTWTPAANSSAFAELEAATIEISNLPPLSLSKQLQYIIQYPHGCLEQTTSAAFPQLYVDALMQVTDKQKSKAESHIKAAIEKIKNFQNSAGAFSYWPGSNSYSDWSNTYAGHFLLEAKARGFAVPEELLAKWTDAQTKASRSWNSSGDTNSDYYYGNESTQAYRLYALAIAGKPDLAGMNRLREVKNKFENTATLLAAAYAAAGKKEAARDLLKEGTQRSWIYNWWGYTYGSNLRDVALRLETYAILEDKRAAEWAVKVAGELGKTDRWYSTQDVATCLRALSKYAGRNVFGEKADFVVSVGGKDEPVKQSSPYYLQDMSGQAGAAISVKNTSGQRLYARYVLQGRPLTGSSVADAQNIKISVAYTDTKGAPIDVSRIKQGTDFIAAVTVTRNSPQTYTFSELALTQVFPAGWEILNTRMNLIGGGSSDPMDYQDVRDDRVMTYFSLPGNSSNNVQSSRTYRFQLNAAYTGRYYLPTLSCEAMYDNRIRASQPGKWIEVI
jgi:alpha-2-macroglobulin